MHAMYRVSSGGAPRIPKIDHRILELRKMHSVGEKLEILDEEYLFWNAYGLDLCMSEQDIDDLIYRIDWLDNRIQVLNNMYFN